MTDELTLADVEELIREAHERGRQSVLSGLKALAELNGSGPAVMKRFDPDREDVISKAWSESQHPRDRNGRFIDANTINALSHSAQGIAQLHANVKPGDEAKLDAAISAAQGEKQHGHPNVRIPSPTSAAPMTPRAEKMAGTVEFAQSLAAAVKSGNMPGDLPGMAKDLATAFSQMDPTDFGSLKGHLGLSPAMGPEQVAGKMLNTAPPTGVPPAKGDRDNQDLDAAMGMTSNKPKYRSPADEAKDDPFGMKTAAEREKTEGSSFWNKPSPAASTPAEPSAPKPESDKPVFGPWSADDLIEAAKPLRREMDESAHDPEAFLRAATEYGTWLKQFGPDELDGLAKAIGHDRPTGNTAKLASKVLLSLSGHDVPASGHTGVVHDGEGGQTTYHEGAVVGKLAAGEEFPSPKAEQAPDVKAAALDKAIPAESAVLSPGAVDEIAGHIEKPNAAMRDEKAVRARLAARLTEPGQLEELATKVFGKNIAEHLPKTEQRNHLLDALAKHARLRAEAAHGKVKPPATTARSVAERIAEGHEYYSKLFRDKESPFKSDYRAHDLWNQARARNAREMEAHLKKHPELRGEFGKYTSIHDANPPPVPASTAAVGSEADHEASSVPVRTADSAGESAAAGVGNAGVGGGVPGDAQPEKREPRNKWELRRERWGKFNAAVAEKVKGGMTPDAAKAEARREEQDAIKSRNSSPATATINPKPESGHGVIVDAGMGEEAGKDHAGKVEVHPPASESKTNPDSGDIAGVPVHPADDEFTGSATDTGITSHGTLKHRPGEGALTARRQGKKFGVQWETPEGEIRHSLHESEQDAALQHDIMSRDKGVVPGSLKTVKPGELKARPKKPEKGTYGNPAIRSGTVAREVMRSGGLNPDAYERTFGSVKEAMDNGVPRAVFYPNGRKGTGHLDTMAKELIGDGHLTPAPDTTHEHEHLLNALSGGKLTPEGMMSHGEKLYREHVREEELAHADEQGGKAATDDAGAAGAGEAPVGELAGPGTGPRRGESVRDYLDRVRKPKTDELTASERASLDRLKPVAHGPGFESWRKPTAASSSPAAVEPVESGSRNLLGEVLPKTFAANRGEQITLDDLHRERDRSGEQGTQAGAVADLPAASGDLFQRENAAAMGTKQPHEFTPQEMADHHNANRAKKIAYLKRVVESGGTIPLTEGNEQGDFWKPAERVAAASRELAHRAGRPPMTAEEGAKHVEEAKMLAGVVRTESATPISPSPSGGAPLTTMTLYNRAQRREEQLFDPTWRSDKKWGMDPRPLSPHILNSLPTQEALRGIDKPMEVSGYVTPWKKTLRDLGGQYDRKRRVWYIPQERMNDLPDAAKVMLRPAYVNTDVAKSLAAWYGIGVPHGEMIA